MNENPYSPEQTAQIRQCVLESRIQPDVRRMFDRFPVLQSAMLVVAQYSLGVSSRYIHFELAFSELETPDFHAFSVAWNELEDPINLPSIGNFVESGWDSMITDAVLWTFQQISPPKLIAAFAAVCPAGGTENFEYPEESYAPYAVLRRKGTQIAIEIVGRIQRPWLDGITTEMD